MNDIFKEQLIKKTPSSKDAALKALIAAVCAALIILSFAVLDIFAPFAAVGLGFAAFLLFGRLDVEYEYAFTNGELDIDAIYGKSRRKRLFSAEPKDFIIFAHILDKEREGDFKFAEVTKDYSSGKIGDDTYMFLYAYGGKLTKFIIEPNEAVFAALKSVIPRSKFHARKELKGGCL